MYNLKQEIQSFVFYHIHGKAKGEVASKHTTRCCNKVGIPLAERIRIRIGVSAVISVRNDLKN